MPRLKAKPEVNVSFKTEWCLSENINVFRDHFTQVFVCLYISYRNRTWEEREVSLEKKLSYKEDTKIYWKGYYFLKKKKIHALKPKYISNSPPLFQICIICWTRFTQHMTCWSHLMKLSGNKFSSLMTERGGSTTLHSAQPFTCPSFFFFNWRDLRYFFFEHNHWCVISSSKNNDASFLLYCKPICICHSG